MGSNFDRHMSGDVTPTQVVKYLFLAIVVFVVFGCFLGWIIQGNDFFLYKAFAPKYEGVRRQVFEQSKSYNQGYIQELQNMQFEYVKADPAHQAALASIILHRAADYPDDKLPTDLRAFIAGLRNENGKSSFGK
jgi:uncharacterized phage-associated protein